MERVHLENSAALKALLGTSKITVVDFSADWCGKKESAKCLLVCLMALQYNIDIQ